MGAGADDISGTDGLLDGPDWRGGYSQTYELVGKTLSVRRVSTRDKHRFDSGSSAESVPVGACLSARPDGRPYAGIVARQISSREAGTGRRARCGRVGATHHSERRPTRA